LSVDAENNWWGASDGPGAPGGGGSGDPVAGVVDFTPWLGGNIICVPDPQEISAADLNHRDEVVLRYLGGGSAPLYGYSLDVEWTVSLATLHSATRPDTGPFAGAAAFQVVNLGPGHVRIDAAIGGAHPGTNGPDDLCKLTFEGIGCGQTALNVTIRRLRDTGNQNITGVTADDGELAVDLVDPTVTAVQIVRTNLPETGYVKNHDDLEVRATVGDACGALDDLTITADLSGLLSGGGGAVPPTSFDPISGLAIWDLADVTLTTPDGGKSVTVTAVDLLGNSGDAGGSTYADNTRPGSISALTAMPGHNEIELTWTNPTGDPDLDNYGIMIRRAEWDGSSPPSQDDYPEYTGTAPSYPDSAAGERIYRQSGMIAGHVDGFAGDGSERDIYYYQAFVFDKAYNYGPAASGARDRATNYWLGDVSPNSWPTGIGNGLVNTGDISALGATYYVAPGGGSWNPHCDVGPTDDGGAFDIPQPDDQVEFEDLMVFSMNFGEVSPFVAPPAGTPDVPTTGPVALAIELPAEFNVGGEFVARIHLDDELGVVQGTHFTVSYDAAVLEYLGATPGALVERTVDAFFMPLVIKDLPDLSIAALGRGATFGGSGILAELRFRVLAPGAIRLGMPEATARSIRNQELLPQAPSDVTADELPLAVVPSRVYLQANQPNPFSQATTLRFGLPAAGAVRLAVFDVSGRSVRTLVNGVLPAAEHVFSWDRRDDSGHAVAAGVYLYRLETEGQTITRKLVVSE